MSTMELPLLLSLPLLLLIASAYLITLELQNRKRGLDGRRAGVVEAPVEHGSAVVPG